MSELGMVSAEDGQSLGQEELEALCESHSSSRDVTRLAKTIFRLAAVLGLGPTGSNAQEQCESHDVKSDENETFGFGFQSFCWQWHGLVLRWLVTGFGQDGSKDAAQRTSASRN